MTTIPDLIAQRDTINRQIAEASLPLLQSAVDQLTTEAVTSLTTSLQPLYDGLPPSEGKTQVGNVLTVLRAVPDVLQREIANMTSEIAEPTPIDPITDAA